MISSLLAVVVEFRLDYDLFMLLLYMYIIDEFY